MWSQQPIISQVAQQFEAEPQQEPPVSGASLQGFPVVEDEMPMEESLPQSAVRPIEQTSAEMVPQQRLMQNLRNRARKFEGAKARQKGELVYG
jgi:hypothetical protein